MFSISFKATTLKAVVQQKKKKRTFPCVNVPNRRSTCLCAHFCGKGGKKNRRRWEKKRCQSVLDEQRADGSGREDAWRDGTMHYSGIVHMKCNRSGKTPRKFHNTPEKLTWGLYLTVFNQIGACGHHREVMSSMNFSLKVEKTDRIFGGAKFASWLCNG